MSNSTYNVSFQKRGSQPTSDTVINSAVVLCDAYDTSILIIDTYRDIDDTGIINVTIYRGRGIS